MGTYGLYHEAATINRDAAPLIATRRWLGRALGVGGQLSARPYSTAPTKRAMANLAIDIEMGFSLPQEGESPHKKWATARAAHSIATFPEKLPFHHTNGTDAHRGG